VAARIPKRAKRVLRWVVIGLAVVAGVYVLFVLLAVAAVIGGSHP
jgi:hypothetical protein